MVETDPYLGLHTLPTTLPDLSVKRISISFSTASITASLEICAPLLTRMESMLVAGILCEPSVVQTTKPSLSRVKAQP